jgi:exosortase
MSNAPTPSGLSVATIGRGLVALLPALALLALVLFTFRDTAVAMVSIWIRSETFTHAFLVPPIVLWLVWRRRAELALLPRQPQPVLLLPITAVCAAWLLAELASVNAATQFALVSLIVLCVPALFGWAITRRLAFPLLFLYFAVPFGDFMVEPISRSSPSN